MLGLLFRYNLRRALRFFRVERFARLVTVTAFFFVFFGIAVGLYFFFREGFSYIKEDTFFGPALSLAAYEIFFLGISGLIFISALITSFFSFFRSDSASWIMASPRFKILFSHSLLKVLFSSLWPIAIIALPGLLAIKSVSNLGIEAFISMIISIVLLAGLAVIAAVVVLVAIAKLLELLSRVFRRRILTMERVGLVLGIIFILMLVFFWLRLSGLDMEAAFQPQDLQAENVDIKVLSDNFKFFPSHLSALSLHEFEYGSSLSGFSMTGLLLIIFLAAAAIYGLVSMWLLSLWQILQEGKFEAREGGTSGVPGKPVRFPRFFQGPEGALFEKEVITTFRNGKNTLWILFVIFIWMIQISANVLLRRSFERYGMRHHDSFPFVLQALQVVTIIYFVSALVLRFDFPSFSLERKTAWIIASAPINLVRQFWSKLLFFSIFFTILAVFFVFLNSAVLLISAANMIFFLVITATAAVSVSAIGLSIGAIWPNFEIDDAETLSTTLPGLFFTVLSLLYGSYGAFSFYQILGSGSFSHLIFFETISVLLVMFFILVSLRKLSRMEFA